jgi:hypothetical protein
MVLAFIAIFFTYGTFVWGFVTYKAHAWFIASQFALAPITFTQALAISAILSMLCIRFTPNLNDADMDIFHNEEDKEKVLKKLKLACIIPWCTLFLMWITKTCFL